MRLLAQHTQAPKTGNIQDTERWLRERLMMEGPEFARPFMEDMGLDFDRFGKQRTNRQVSCGAAAASMQGGRS
jgi:hypothetical protein